jgi:hypothetical protein
MREVIASIRAFAALAPARPKRAPRPQRHDDDDPPTGGGSYIGTGGAGYGGSTELAIRTALI